MNEVKEKDNFWLIVAGVVVAFAATMFTIKNLGHKDYAMAEQAIAEDASNSAYHVSK